MSSSYWKNVEELIGAALRCAFDDWAQLIGFEARVEDVRVFAVRDGDLIRRAREGRVSMTTRIEGEYVGPIEFVFPRELVERAASLALMIPYDPETSRFAWGGESELDSAHELMNLFCGSLTRSLQQQGKELRVSQSVDHLDVRTPIDPVLPCRDRVAVMRFEVDVAGDPLRVICLLGESSLSALGAAS